MASPRSRRLKLVLGGLWLAVFVLALLAWARSGLALTAVPALLESWLGAFGLGRAAAVYILLYAVRPLLLFPATLLTIASGLLFGPWLGILFTIVGENASANLAFALARWFGRPAVAAHESALLRHWDEKLRANAIVAVMTMRLVMLPFDAVNYGCGLTAMRQRDYAIGTFVGILPSLIGFVLLGGIAAAGVRHRAWVLTVSVGCMLFGFAIARLLRQREGRKPLNCNAKPS